MFGQQQQEFMCAQPMLLQARPAVVLPPNFPLPDAATQNQGNIAA